MSFNITVAVVRSFEKALYLLQYQTSCARVFYRLLYRHSRNVKFGCQKFTNLHSFSSLQEKKSLLAPGEVFLLVFFQIISLIATNALVILFVIGSENEIPKINTLSLWLSWKIKAFNEVFSSEKRGYLVIASE